jgi:hypothetical protein
MINHIWTVLCSRVITDQQSNNVSLIDVIEQITVAFPEEQNAPGSIPVNLSLITLWERTDQPVRKMGRIRVQFPSGDFVDQEITYEVDLTTFQRTRTIIGMNGFPVRGAGRHTIHVDLRSDDGTGWDEVACIPLIIVIMQNDA